MLQSPVSEVDVWIAVCMQITEKCLLQFRTVVNIFKAMLLAPVRLMLHAMPDLLVSFSSAWT